MKQTAETKSSQLFTFLSKLLFSRFFSFVSLGPLFLLKHYLLEVMHSVALYCTSKLALHYVLQEQFSEVLDAMFEVLVKPQHHIIDQGDDGDNFYVIEMLVSDLTVLLRSHCMTFYQLCNDFNLCLCVISFPGVCMIFSCRRTD